MTGKLWTVIVVLAGITSVPARTQSADMRVAPPVSAVASAKAYWAGISVADAKASAKWYQQKLHFYIYKTMDLPEHHLKIVFLDLNGFSLELIQFAGAMSFEVVKKRVPELTDRDRLLGFVKLGFQIAEVDALAAELKRDGTKLLMEPTEDREFHDRFLMLQDPDGNVLQFFQKLK